MTDHQEPPIATKDRLAAALRKVATKATSGNAAKYRAIRRGITDG